jgi:hypothetical protein
MNRDREGADKAGVPKHIWSARPLQDEVPEGSRRMNSIIYVVGLIVVVAFILKVVGVI